MSNKGSSLIACLRTNPANLRHHRRNLLAEIRVELANARSEEERELLHEIRAAVVTNTIRDTIRSLYLGITEGFMQKIRRLFPT
jgi:uncharacterized OsmC-like protein